MGYLRMFAGLGLKVLVAGLVFLPLSAHAGAWPQGEARTEIIVKAEVSGADRQFNASGNAAIDLGTWEEKTVSFYFDHGLTDRLDIYGKANIQDIQTDTEDFSGLGSVELGIKATVLKTDRTVFSLSVSAEGGNGRRNAYEATGNSDADIEVRAYVGHGFTVGSIPAFFDAQLARRASGGDRADEWRADLTLGVKPTTQWMVLAQAYAGRTDAVAGAQAKWVNNELSVVRFFDSDQKTGLQLGLRQTVSGENVPEVKAVSLSLWKRF